MPAAAARRGSEGIGGDLKEAVCVERGARDLKEAVQSWLRGIFFIKFVSIFVPPGCLFP